MYVLCYQCMSTIITLFSVHVLSFCCPQHNPCLSTGCGSCVFFLSLVFIFNSHCFNKNDFDQLVLCKKYKETTNISYLLFQFKDDDNNNHSKIKFCKPNSHYIAYCFSIWSPDSIKTFLVISQESQRIYLTVKPPIIKPDKKMLTMTMKRKM